MSGYDPWQKCQTRSGLAADQVISALQKEIRRNHVENAAALAYEMLMTSSELEEYLWLRLRVISVEDVGFGDVSAPVLVNALDQMRSKCVVGSGDRWLFAIHAVRFLCSRTKDRSSDEMFSWIRKAYEAKTLVPQIPDYALDMHTLEGQRLGKDERTFYSEGAVVAPELENRDRTYLERILKNLPRQ